jgi:hypothetical protein
VTAAEARSVVARAAAALRHTVRTGLPVPPDVARDLDAQLAPVEAWLRDLAAARRAEG